MRELTNAVRHTSGRSSRRRPLSFDEPVFQGEGSFTFPPTYRLIITTTRGVYTWDAHGITQIFSSGSEGIVAARRVTSGSEMLAVADSQVVVLHEINGGKKSYRLKGSEVGSPLMIIMRRGANCCFTGPRKTAKICQRVKKIVFHNYSAELCAIIFRTAFKTSGPISRTSFTTVGLRVVIQLQVPPLYFDSSTNHTPYELDPQHGTSPGTTQMLCISSSRRGFSPRARKLIHPCFRGRDSCGHRRNAFLSQTRKG